MCDNLGGGQDSPLQLTRRFAAGLYNMWGDIMRIDSSFSSQIDVNFNKPQVEPVENARDATAVKETSPTVEDFEKAIGKEDFEQIIESIKDIPTSLTFTRLEFRVHEDTNRVMVKIFDRSSDELITEIPPEKFLDLIAGLWRQAGLIVDERV